MYTISLNRVIIIILVTVSVAILLLASYKYSIKEGMTNEVNYTLQLIDTTKRVNGMRPVGSFQLGVYPDVTEQDNIGDVMDLVTDKIDFTMNTINKVQSDFGQYGAILIITPKDTITNSYTANIFPKTFELDINFSGDKYKIGYNVKNTVTYSGDPAGHQTMVMNIGNVGPIYDINNTSIGNVLKDNTNANLYRIYIENGTGINKICILVSA
jgi:hypothetical protein